MDPTAARDRIAAATRRTLIAMAAPVDNELLRYGAEVQAAEAMALVAERLEALERTVEMQRRRIEVLEKQLKEKEAE
jgi:hypothetical protein